MTVACLVCQGTCSVAPFPSHALPCATMHLTSHPTYPTSYATLCPATCRCVCVVSVVCALLSYRFLWIQGCALCRVHGESQDLPDQTQQLVSSTPFLFCRCTISCHSAVSPSCNSRAAPAPARLAPATVCVVVDLQKDAQPFWL